MDLQGKEGGNEMLGTCFFYVSNGILTRFLAGVTSLYFRHFSLQWCVDGETKQSCSIHTHTRSAGSKEK